MSSGYRGYYCRRVDGTWHVGAGRGEAWTPVSEHEDEEAARREARELTRAAKRHMSDNADAECDRLERFTNNFLGALLPPRGRS